MTTRRLTFHILPNAHLDPVWLWDWREGLNEGLITARTVLDLMEELPTLTFVRGEASIYEHIERTDRKIFKRIERMVDLGRWDIVGGTLVQPDSNLASTEVLCREFEIGLKYFESRFNKRPTVVWQADSFSHTPGWPNILKAFGMEAFVFTRPQRTEFSLESPVFYWRGTGSHDLLCYRQHWRWYCSDRHNVKEVLDFTLKSARNQPWQNVGVLVGLGNHGGGPTRRHLIEIEQWAMEHSEVEVQYSTLHGFIRKLQSEIANRPANRVPTIEGDLGYCLRGCYSSVQRFKAQYRQAEDLVRNAQIAQAIVTATLRPDDEPVDLAESWHALCFNAFHDILPGSSIERAYDHQSAWTGLATHRAHQVQLQTLNWLASKVDTQVPKPRREDLPRDVPILIWNPLAKPFEGAVEMEASLDYRPLWAFKDRKDELPVVVTDARGKLLPFQQIDTEHRTMQSVPWRARVLVPLNIPAWGWSVVRVGWRDESPVVFPKITDSVADRKTSKKIESQFWTIQAKQDGIQIRNRAKPNLFAKSHSVQVRLLEDTWGSWGGMEEERGSYVLDNELESFQITKAEVTEKGPVRSSLWVHWEGKKSWVELTFSLTAGDPAIAVQGRMLINERSSRLKLVIPCRGIVDCDVPGGTVRNRVVEGHNPVGRWVTRTVDGAVLGVASDVLSDCDFTKSELRLTLARASRYAEEVPIQSDSQPWVPAVDCGELKFKLAIFSNEAQPESVIERLLSAPLIAHVLPGPGKLRPKGELGRLSPKDLKVLSVEAEGNNLQMRVQNLGKHPAKPRLQLLHKEWKLARILPQEIRNYSIGL